LGVRSSPTLDIGRDQTTLFNTAFFPNCRGKNHEFATSGNNLSGPLQAKELPELKIVISFILSGAYTDFASGLRDLTQQNDFLECIIKTLFRFNKRKRIFIG
jgi:hypothetical protein